MLCTVKWLNIDSNNHKYKNKLQRMIEECSHKNVQHYHYYIRLNFIKFFIKTILCKINHNGKQVLRIITYKTQC